MTPGEQPLAVQRFRIAADRAAQDLGTDPAVLPACLARAARDALGVDSAAITVRVHGLPIPLGTSDAGAARAERLQATLGDGPTMEAERSGSPLTADPAGIVTRWSSFARELFRHTPYEAVAAYPFVLFGGMPGALTVWLSDPDHDFAGLADELAVLAPRVCAELSARPDAAGPPVDHPFADTDYAGWLDLPAARVREAVWIAVGMAVQRLAVDPADALSLLRGYAFSTDSVVDDVAARICARTLDVADLAP